MQKFRVLLALAFLLVSMPIQSVGADFSDVSGHANETAIDYLQTQEIVKGYADGSFQPERSINRAEFVKTIVGSLSDFSETELQNCQTNYFADTDAKAWYTPYLCYAKEKGLIDGYPDGSFKPAQLVNFAEASKIIANAQNLNADKNQAIWYEGFVEKLEENFAIPNSIQTFASNVTRGEMAEMLWRLKTKNQSQVSKRLLDLEIITADLPVIQSCTELKNRLQNGAQKMSYGYDKRMFSDGDLAVPEAVMSEDAEQNTTGSSADEKSADDAGASDYSSTNVQVQGVDEADIVKNDGKYIYLIKGETVRIIEAYPPTAMQEVAKITLDDESFTPLEIYTDSAQMVIIGQTYAEMNARSYYPYYSSQETKIYIYDISDKNNPKKERSVAYEGSYSTSRKVDKNLYLVMNKSASFYEPLLYDTETTDSGASVDNLVPKMLDSADNTERPMVGCAQVRYFPHFETPNYLIVSGIDLSDAKSKITKELFLGASENVYASKTGLYVATASWDEEQVTENSDTFWQRKENTSVYKFNLDGNKIEFDAKGKVPGRILNQFSMDEYNKHFRIATTIGEMWNDSNPSTNNLYILNDEMEQTGAIENIAPGERIYSVRFLGKRGFMVTFKTVDPLFVMDLSDPENPVIAGKLKIPGWSDYLHPYDENHLLGFGKEVDESIDADKVHSESAVYYTAVQGMKISLFDITDLENPKEMFKEVIGDRDTTSELLTNHKALLFDKEKELLAFPITVTEDKSKNSDCTKYTYSTCPQECSLMCLPSVCNENGACTKDCGDVPGSCVASDSYGNIQTVFQGAYVYTVNLEDGFKLRGKISHYDDPEIYTKSGDYFYGEYTKNIQRIIYIGDYLYSISQDIIKSATLNTVEEKAKLELN